MPDILRADTDDSDEIRDIWSRAVPTATIELDDPDVCTLRWLSVQLEGLAIVRSSLTGSGRARIQPEGQLFACRLTAPRATVHTGRSPLDPALPLASDGFQGEVRWEGSVDVTALIFDRTAAQELARHITGDALLSLRLTSPTPRTARAGDFWNRSFDYLLAAALVSEGDPLIRASLVRHALVSTLACFPSTYYEANLTGQRPASVPVLRRAMAFMDAHAHRPITLDDVAEAAHISARGLQYAFRRTLQTTPRDYLRTVRLDGAHRELQNATDGDTVAAVAKRWGFANPSRFSALYRQVYGRSPRETLDLA